MQTQHTSTRHRRPARPTFRFARLGFVSALTLAALAGCGRTFTVEVHNDSRHRVMASIRAERLGASALDARTLGPGASIVLGPSKAPALEFVELVIEPGNTMGEMPSKIRLNQGRSVAIIEDAGATEFGTVRVRVLQGTAAEHGLD